jgi:serine/threonine-protein kinase
MDAAGTMFRLKTFGQLTLTSEAAPVPGAACQRKSLALLAILAASGERGISRDRLQALLWPEVEAEKVGHRLAQALYALRRELGEMVLGSTASEPRLDPRLLPTDVAEFTEALERGDLERAVGIYRGPFLDGFHLGGAPVFDRWMEEERARFSREYLSALGALAARADRRGDRLEAVEWWGRLAREDRLSARVAVGYMEALARTGERAAALQYARVHEALLREELEATPDPAVTTLVDRLKIEAEEDKAFGTVRGPPESGACQSQKFAGRYLAESVLHEGEMATVYAAQDLKHGRRVALKVFADVTDADLLARLTAATHLHHPHILPLYDAGLTDSGAFCVTPQIEEGSLRARFEREGPLPVTEAIQIAREAAEALDYAHRHGVLHGHLTPENILLEEGHALLADFGLRLSQGGVPKGDIHALAQILYEILTGEQPKLSAVEALSVRALRHSVPDEVDAALERALAPAQADRFASAADFAAALGTNHRNSSRPRVQEHSIAVLPFVNLSPDQENEYFSDGMSEELIGALARIPALRVASRSSSFALKGKGLDARTIGERLGVRMLVEGSVRRAGDQLRVTAQLVNASDGFQRWSQTFDRSLADVFAVQEEIARAIVSTLELNWDSRGDGWLIRPGTTNIEVYDKYLLGRFHWNKRSPEGLYKSIDYFRAALAADPGLALAYTGLADAHHMLALYGVAAPKKVYPAARQAAARALEIAPDLAEAHVSSAHVSFCFDLDWAAAEAGYRRAIELDPGHAPAHHWYAWMLTAMNRKAEATREVHRALALEPLSPIIVARAGHILGYTSSLAEGEALSRLALELSPDFPIAKEVLGLNLIYQGRYDEGIPLLEELAAQPGSKLVYCLTWALAKAGRGEAAMELLSRIDFDPKAAEVPSGYWVFWLATTYAVLGRWDRAFELAERLLEERCFAAILTRADPGLAILDHDSRHKNFRRKLGLD